ncbi:MAG: FxLYD domain-containing protein [Patescibacteria group bacterium]|jgi:hypothetical protein
MLEEQTSQVEQKEKQNFMDRSKDLSVILLIAGALLIILGSFLTWGQAITAFGNLNISGIIGDGKFTALMGLLIIVLVVLDKAVFYKKEIVQKIIPFIHYLLSIIAMAIVVWDGVNISSTSGEFVKVAAGAGVYVVFFGGLIATVGVFTSLIKTKKKIATIVLAVLLVVILIAVYIPASRRTSQSTSNSKVSTSENKPAEKSKIKVDVVSKNYTTNSIGDAIILGEVKNNGDGEAYISNITASLMAGGKVVASGNSNIYFPRKIAKGETVPFKVSINNPPQYDDIKVEVDAQSDSYQKCSRLDVVSQTPRTGQYGDFSIAGEIENKTDKKFTSANVYVYLLDENNKVINFENTYVQNLEKGATKPYEVSIYSSSGAQPNYTTIKVIAEGCN